MRYRNQIQKFLATKRHLRVEEIFGALKQEHSLLSLATVYRNLKALEAKGEVISFLHPDGAVRYELPSNEHHQHLVCEGCGAIVEIRFGFLDELSENLQKRAQFLLHPHRLSMVGKCNACR